MHLFLTQLLTKKGSTDFVVNSQAWYITGACLRREFHLQQGAKGEPIRVCYYPLQDQTASH
ncbi:hypothetical protein DPMN_002729 [Dreissena polymorpha]|uniref:Uncharacterized protein n=1 Tax=Dreissena polymorpha TaxID=45954 RepID=A0A9D4MNE2_DREPO|nr:hypothetical protein DPMN_002729 [Dreissena polymorpha]